MKYRAVIAFAAICLSGSADAALTISISQEDTSVFEGVSGSLDITGLTRMSSSGYFGAALASNETTPAVASIEFDPPGQLVSYSGIATGKGFLRGITALTKTPYVIGNSFRFVPTGGYITFDSSYVSGDEVLALSQYQNTTIAALGFREGSYIFEAPSRDLIYLNIGKASATPVSYLLYPASEAPEPATWAMMIGGFGAIGAAMRRRRRAAVRVAFA